MSESSNAEPDEVIRCRAEWKRLMTSLPPSSGPSAFDKKALFSTTAATDSLYHYDFAIDADLTTGATSFSMSRREYRRVMAEADKVGLSAEEYLRQVWQRSVERSQARAP